MGEVVLAEHLGLGKQVVVKLLHDEFAKDAGVVQRMQIEARSLAALTSPYIVQVTDFGQTATGRTYIVMERLVGRTLGAEIRLRGALPVAEAIGYVLQVLAGLDAAHAMGIIHRDIKPDNIFLCDPTKDTPRTVKILDFGVAKVLSVATEIQRPALPQLVTEEGGIVGTPRVVAPEQALGKPVDARTDVYAAGLLLYTMLAGSGPFAHIKETVELLKANVMERPVPPSQRAKQAIPPALDAAVLRALEKRAADRFQSAEEFASELRRIAGTLAATDIATTAPLPLVTVPRPPLPPRGEGGSEDCTVKLAGQAGAAAGAATRERAFVEPTLAAPGASGEPEAPEAGDIAQLDDRARRRTFAMLMLLGIAVSTLLLVMLSRMAP
jgi:serine/threonine-protein kinase